MRNKGNVKKDFIFNTIGTGINAFNSFFDSSTSSSTFEPFMHIHFQKKQ